MVEFNNFLITLDGYIGGAPWFPMMLIGAGIFFTIYLGFPQFKFFGQGWRILSGKYIKDSTKGETTPFQALTTALSGTVGTGNIGGVALAIWVGGPAAIFWMWITAIVGMTTKFVEVSLAHKYRITLNDGTISGGPFHYIEHGMNMKWLAILFAVLMMFSAIGTGNMPQINNIAEVMNSEFSIEPLITGSVLSILLLLVIVGGIKRIATIASALVPTMGLIYITGSLIVILDNYQNIIPSFHAIFSQVFSGSSAVGGFLGASFALALQKGVARGAFSNEAGQGSSPIAHASSKTEDPVEEGIVSLLEPFIDTIIVCTITALVILSSGAWSDKHLNTFDKTSTVIIEGVYSDTTVKGDVNESDVTELRKYINGQKSTISNFDGVLNVVNGVISNDNITILHKNSIAEDVTILSSSGDYELGYSFNGSLSVSNGSLAYNNVVLEGKSLVHSAELTAIAFKSGVLGVYGGYIVAIGLLLFAFSTAIAWSYYGDRSAAYVFGEKSVIWYRLIYVACFFSAAIIDTEVVWNIAYIIGPLVTVPNIIAMVVMRKEIKSMTSNYVSNNK
ncbi:sodium:alanine symporter family protein [Gammaproteobacteria bacterium]|jgi:AGCS family alanine or glycine:cation symporter|nr:sodium:alanine symporter family protein [Gammaproteobacteria bacterium]MDB9973981.1 sodium:alanine symporter family protein [Gammaproteobacteria bacterium]